MSSWDFQLNGIKGRIRRDAEGGGYNRRFVRVSPDDPRLFPIPDLYTSRPDLVTFFQDSWTRGMLWAEPRMTEQLAAAYAELEGFSPVDRPGALVPFFQILDTETLPTYYGPLARSTVTGTNRLYSMRDNSLYYLDETASTISWTDTTVDIGTASKQTYDLTQVGSYLLRLDQDGNVSRWDGSTVNSNKWATTIYPGSALVSGLGKTNPMLWTGSKLIDLEEAGTTADVTDDGLGRDVLGLINPTQVDVNRARLATGSSEGVWYVKNVYDRGQVVAWLFRVERDAAGNIFSNPVATLPPGVLAVALGYHLGAPIVLALPANPGVDNLQATAYILTGDSLSVIGTFDGADAVGSFLFSDGERAYFGGDTRVFYYDAARGGLHPTITLGSTKYFTAVPSKSGSERSLLVVGGDETLLSQERKSATTDEPTLDSLPFDFGRPLEEKSITKVSTWITQVGSDPYQDWKIYLKAEDESSWTLVATHSSDVRYEETELATPRSGKRFQYRIALDDNDVDGGALEALAFEGFIARQLETYELIVDGAELKNVENEVVDPDDVYDNWVSLGQTNTAVDFYDQFRYYNQAKVADVTAQKVRIQSVQIQKQASGESMISVTLVAV